MSVRTGSAAIALALLIVGVLTAPRPLAAQAGTIVFDPDQPRAGEHVEVSYRPAAKLAGEATPGQLDELSLKGAEQAEAGSAAGKQSAAESQRLTRGPSCRLLQPHRRLLPLVVALAVAPDPSR